MAKDTSATLTDSQVGKNGARRPFARKTKSSPGGGPPEEGGGRPIVFDPEKIMPSPATVTVFIAQMGDSTLIVNQFPEKAQREMVEKQTTEPGGKKLQEARNPFGEFRGAFHVINPKKVPKAEIPVWGTWPCPKDTFGFPCSSIKMGMLYVAPVCGVSKADIIRSVFVDGDLMPLEADKIVFRQDMVRIGTFPNMKSTPRWRPEFVNWRARFTVSFNEKIINPKQVAALILNAGFSSGLGEWRPSAPLKGGSHGRYIITK